MNREHLEPIATVHASASGSRIDLNVVRVPLGSDLIEIEIVATGPVKACVRVTPDAARVIVNSLSRTIIKNWPKRDELEEEVPLRVERRESFLARVARAANALAGVSAP